jgi:hypothetical protein
MFQQLHRDAPASTTRINGDLVDADAGRVAARFAFGIRIGVGQTTGGAQHGRGWNSARGTSGSRNNRE